MAVQRRLLSVTMPKLTQNQDSAISLHACSMKLSAPTKIEKRRETPTSKDIIQFFKLRKISSKREIRMSPFSHWTISIGLKNSILKRVSSRPRSQMHLQRPLSPSKRDSQVSLEPSPRKKLRHKRLPIRLAMLWWTNWGSLYQQPGKRLRQVINPT